jgi:hypothetical protein
MLSIFVYTLPKTRRLATQMPFPPVGSTVDPLMGKIFDHYVYIGFEMGSWCLIPAFVAGIVWLLSLQKLYTIGWFRALVIAVFIWIVTSVAGWFLPVL